MQQQADRLGKGAARLPGCKGIHIGWPAPGQLGHGRDLRLLANCAACRCAAQAARPKSDGYTCRTAQRRLADGGSNPPSSTIIEAPTVLSWGFFSSDSDSSRVFARVHADSCGLRRLAVWPVLGRLSLSPGHSSPGLRSPRMARSPQGACLASFGINGLRADGSSGWIASLPTRRGQGCRSEQSDPARHLCGPT